ncbi:MAG: OmpA family protein [Acidimicrobiales bacterium]
MSPVWLAIAATALLASAGQPPVQVPADQTQPTVQQIAASIQVWDPTGSVSPLETETTDGDETVLVLDTDILFAFGSAQLTPSATQRIGQLVSEIPNGASVSVRGHTDDIGTDADNQTLSEARASTVAAAVAAARPDLTLDVSGRGEAEPVTSNGTPEGRELNRRVEIRFVR